ncbi:MAG TPA: asparaginase [Gemmatimonadales bacterium]|nr:asparaginase [Gemmatimonadales bacterium]
MRDFRIESTRGTLVESVHRVSAAVVDVEGGLVAASGDPDLVTFWRSAAKPFQALPAVADGAADRFGLGAEELALACASHSSEPAHLVVARRMLERIGCTEADLACGPHPPLGPAVAEEVVRRGTPMSPRWSNCSGKHAGMLALARHHGWPTAGYERAGHPVQDRILAELERWTGVPAAEVALAVDGCTAACFGLPLRAMALAYARFATEAGGPAGRLRAAMGTHPHLVAGTGRVDTEIIRASAGRVLAKVGAEGVYGACVVPAGLGIALKVEDGDMRSAPVALAAVLRDLAEAGLLPPLDELAPVLGRFARSAIHNTRSEFTGELRAGGGLRFRSPSRTQPVRTAADAEIES